MNWRMRAPWLVPRRKKMLEGAFVLVPTMWRQSDSMIRGLARSLSWNTSVETSVAIVFSISCESLRKVGYKRQKSSEKFRVVAGSIRWRFVSVTLTRMATTVGTQTRIGRQFEKLQTSGELGIVAYITAGDPSLDATLQFVLALAEAGADVIELGVPFSDPLADGPTIQRASERALKSSISPAGGRDFVRSIHHASPPAN